jgi:hypothetical protein
VSPGISDLTGERYIQLKCDEIDSHCFKARAFENWNLGLAKFDLGNFGYQNSRFDFASLPPRRFHPITRLNNLTLQFQRPDGTLYDFKGVDHTLILSVVYIQINDAVPGINLLNPHYDNNIQKYLSTRVYDMNHRATPQDQYAYDKRIATERESSTNDAELLAIQRAKQQPARRIRL